MPAAVIPCGMAGYANYKFDSCLKREMKLNSLGGIFVTLHTESWDTILYASVDGEIDFDSYRRLAEQLAALLAEQRISRILLDLRHLTAGLQVIERIGLAVEGTGHASRLGIHPIVAVVGPSDNGLGVIAAQSLGADIELFTGIQEALDWLNNSPVDLWREPCAE